MFAKCPNRIKFAETVPSADEQPVNPHLAADLRDLDALRRRGEPISVQNAANIYYDGVAGDARDVAFEDRRGVDLNDVWNRAMSGSKARRKTGAKLTPAQVKGGE